MISQEKLKEFREHILDLAIRGKLVEQRSEEGTAEDLYQQIQEEKAKLIKEGKLKEGKPLAPIDEDEIPFDIPEGWKWVRLSSLCSVISDGTHQTPEYVKNGIPFLSVKDISSGVIDFSNTKFISELDSKELNKRSAPESGDILVCRIGTLGKALKIPKGSPDFSIFVSLGLIKTVNKDVSEFIADVINSPFGFNWIQLVKVGGGTHTAKINLEDLRNFIVPLPPLEEQKRIVAKVENYFSVIGKAEDLLKRKVDLDGQIKEKILQMAIQGKLVEQRPEEGTAEDLYQQIQEEKQNLIKEGKLKKEKPLAPIEDDEIPFDIPCNWKWVRLKNICSKIVDGDHNPPKGENSATDYLMLSASNINQDTLIDLNKARYLSKECYLLENERTKLEKGDILLTTVGTIGRSCIFQGGMNICFQRSVTVISAFVFNKYLKYILDSNYVFSFMNNNAKGTAQKGFYLNQVDNLVVPIPPLAEQKRIVDKVEELLALCDKFKLK